MLFEVVKERIIIRSFGTGRQQPETIREVESRQTYTASSIHESFYNMLIGEVRKISPMISIVRIN